MTIAILWESRYRKFVENKGFVYIQFITAVQKDMEICRYNR